MSYTSLPYQPIIFNSTLPEGCEGCGSEYSQLVDFNDQLFWQLEAGQCGEVEFFDETLVGPWTQDGSTITGGGTSTGGYIASYLRYDVVPNFIVTITVSDIIGVLRVLINGGSFLDVSTQGTHSLYLTTSDLTSNAILIAFSNGGQPFDGSFVIDSVVPVPNGGLFAGIVDAQTLAVVERLDPVITTSQQYLTAAIDMADVDIEPGCYRLAIADYCTNTCGQYFIYNPYFNGNPLCLDCLPIGWTSTPVTGSNNWNVGNGEATIDLTAIGNATNLVSVTELCEDTDYYVEIEVESIINARLRLQVDGNNYGTAITTAGTYNFTITVTDSGPLSLFGSQFGASLDGEIVVKRVTVRADKNWVSYDQYSDLITVGDYSDNCKFFKIEGCNAENQFGLAFNGTSFLPGIRLEGRRFRAQYNSDVDLFRYASGKAVTSYADIRKRVSYFFGQLPEYVFDFLSIITYFDNLYVNGELYSPAEADFPDIEYNDGNNLGSITIDLYKKNEKVRKTVCTAADANCLPSILDLDDEPFILAQDGDRLLTQNNINLYQE
jgi:hypothetical protein